MRATFFTVKVMLKIDVTTGEAVIPQEMAYAYPLLFEERSIPIKAYNLQMILAEKIENEAIKTKCSRCNDFDSILHRSIRTIRMSYWYNVDECDLRLHIGLRKPSPSSGMSPPEGASLATGWC